MPGKVKPHRIPTHAGPAIHSSISPLFYDSLAKLPDLKSAWKVYHKCFKLGFGIEERTLENG
jgi:hypothetical protein